MLLPAIQLAAQAELTIKDSNALALVYLVGAKAERACCKAFGSCRLRRKIR